MFVHASISENGTIGGAAGDQTGKEVCITDDFNFNYDTIIRFPEVLRWRLWNTLVILANNNNIGYSQFNRNSLLKAWKDANYEECEIEYCNCDCSSFVASGLIMSGLPESAFNHGGNLSTTRTLEVDCASVGAEIIKEHVPLLDGDILLKTGEHVLVYFKELL